MGKAAAATVFLMALAFTLFVAADAAPPAAFRRSRFLADLQPPNYFDCVKKLPQVCLQPGSPGKTCCKGTGPSPIGTCTDTESSVSHCGSCNHTCMQGELCCGGKCVDILKDKKNCGKCSNVCYKKCQYGMCDYAG